MSKPKFFFPDTDSATSHKLYEEALRSDNKDVKRLVALLENADECKVAAIDRQDYEMAGRYRKDEKDLLQKLAELLHPEKSK